MPEQNGGRKKNVTGMGNGVHKRGEGLGTGPVGSGSGMPGPGGQPTGSGRASGSNVTRSSGGMLKIIIIVAVLLIGHPAESEDSVSGATERNPFESIVTKVN